MSELAVKGPITVVAAIIRNSRGQVLLARRPTSHTIAGGLLEFPGGKIEAGESPEAALVREIREELGVEISIAHTRGQRGCIGIASHVYPGQPSIHILLLGYHADISPREESKIQLTGVAEVKWISPDQIPSASEFAAADIPFLEHLFK